MISIPRRYLRIYKYAALALLAVSVAIVAPGVARRIMYPLKYESLILESSREFSLSPYLIAAVIKVESGFQAEAVSPKNARGLMQILPETAQEGATALGMTSHTIEALFDPRTNIRIGTWYLTQLLVEFNGDSTFALAAYNGGLRNVREWHKQGLLKQGGDMSAIPFKETRDFIGKVQVALQNYHELYARQLGPKDARFVE